MSMSDPASIERKITARLFVMRVAWAGILTGLLIFALLSAFILLPNKDASPLMFWLFLPLSVLLVALSFPIKQKFVAQTMQAQDESQRAAGFQTGSIIAWALCESAGLFGILARVLSGSHYYYALFILAALALLAHFPRREQLLAVTFKNRF